MSRRTGTVLALLLGALTPPVGTVCAAASAAEASARMRAAGFMALNTGDLRTAEARFAAALAYVLSDGDALGGMGVVRLRQRRFADAVELLSRASRTGRAGQWAEALATARYFAGLDAVRAQIAAGRIAEAQAAGEAVLALGYRQDSEVRELLAGIAAGQGRHAEAAALYRQAALAAVPADTPRLIAAASRETAGIASDMGDLAGAEAALRQGMAADPANIWVRHDLAQVLIARGQPDQAAVAVQPLLTSVDPQALHAAALVAWALDRPFQAEALLARIAPADRSASVRAFAIEAAFDADIARAQALASSQGSGAAVGEYRRIAARPGIGGARQAAIANAVLQLGDGDAAATIADEAFAAHPAEPSVRAALADLLMRSGRLAREHGAGGLALARLRTARAAWPEREANAVPLAKLDAEIVDLWRERAARFNGTIAYRHRSGEAGLGRLDEVVASARASTAIGPGRIELHGEVITLDAGTLRGAAAARFGLNPTLSVLGLARLPGRQRARGVGSSIGYASDTFSAEAGLTTVGRGAVRAVGRASATVHPAAGVSTRAWVDRKPVTDSIVAYAGAREPSGGARWGRVMRTGAGLSLGADDAGSGVYAQARYGHYDGRRVRANEAVQVDAGGYLRVVAHGHSTVTAGLNLDIQRFRRNENGYSIGTGGYFSPQRFAALSVPLRYRLTSHDTELALSATPGVQRYREAATPLYPFDAAEQAQLKRLHAGDPSVATHHPEHRAEGFAFAAQFAASRYVGDRLRLGAEAGYDGFGSYREWRLTASLRASFGRGQ